MKFSVALIYLASLAATASAAMIPNRVLRAEIAPAATIKRAVQPPRRAEGDCKTNAECMQKGKPLKPARVRGNQARQAQASSTTFTHTGTIQVRDTTGAILGYVAAARNIFGEYGVAQASTNALTVTFSTSTGTTGLNIQIGDSTYPYLGYTVGYANTDNDLTAGSFNYAYLTGVAAATGTGFAPTDGSNTFSAATVVPQASETAVWSYDATTQVLTPGWVNADGSQAQTSSLYYTQDDVLIQTGDVNAYDSSFGTGSPRVVLQFVPA